MWYSYWGGHGLKESRIVFFFNGNEIRSVPYQEEFLRDLLRVIKRYESNNPFKAVSDSRCNSAIIHVIDKEGWQYTWENENLIKAIKDDISFEAQYDTSGRRIRKKIFKKGQLIKYQAFSYDGNNLSAIFSFSNLAYLCFNSVCFDFNFSNSVSSFWLNFGPVFLALPPVIEPVFS